jgi:protease PrsW
MTLVAVTPSVIGLLPVVTFLTVLLYFDSYKLVRLRMVLGVVACGAVIAAVCYAINADVRAMLGVDALTFARYVAPVIEELLKAAVVVALIRTHRIGFPVDAAICGFAVGTGFAVVENLYYARALGDYGVLLWLVRGLGTAVMHGSTSAIVGILSKSFADRHRSSAWWVFLPGLAIAIASHAIYNQFFVNPLLATAVMCLLMPPLVIAVFERSERVTQHWLSSEFDSDLELLDSILTGELGETRVGRYLESIRHRFPGTVVADMLCLLRIEAELGLRAKARLVARSAGVEIPLDDVEADLAEMDFLKKAIGPTGLMAISPILRQGGRDAWQLSTLER